MGLTKLFDFSAGLINRSHNPLDAPVNSIAAGSNIQIDDKILKTRPGSSVMSTGSLPAGEVMALQNVRFPTNESSYLVAQVHKPGTTLIGANIGGIAYDGGDLLPDGASTSFPCNVKMVSSHSGGPYWSVAGGDPAYPNALDFAADPAWNFGLDDVPVMPWRAYAYILKKGSPCVATLRVISNNRMEWIYKVTNDTGTGNTDGILLKMANSSEVMTTVVTGTATVPFDEWWRIQVEFYAGQYTLRAQKASDWITGTIIAQNPVAPTYSDATNAGLAIWYIENYEDGDHTFELDCGPVVVATCLTEVGRTDPATWADGETVESWSLYASNDQLPTDSGTFKEIYTFDKEPGVCTFGPLNDRVVITEGKAAPPLVWGGCMSTDASDWMHLLHCLVAQDGVRMYDVSPYVCDKDPDTVAQVGGIRPWGWMAFCTDCPTVSDFWFDVESPNTGTAGTTANTFHAPMQIMADADVNRQDLKATIANWVQDSGAAGHFTTSGGAAVTLGAGKTNPDVVPGVIVKFADVEVMILSQIGDGSGSSGVTLSAAHAGAAVLGIYGLTVDASGLTVNYQTGAMASAWSASLSLGNSVAYAGYTIRQKQGRP